jgi:hypothetical protein
MNIEQTSLKHITLNTVGAMGLARCLYFFKTNISGLDHIFESYFLHSHTVLIQINTKICSLLKVSVYEIELDCFRRLSLFFRHWQKKNTDSIEKSFFGWLYGPYDVTFFNNC